MSRYGRHQHSVSLLHLSELDFWKTHLPEDVQSATLFLEDQTFTNDFRLRSNCSTSFSSRTGICNFSYVSCSASSNYAACSKTLSNNPRMILCGPTTHDPLGIPCSRHSLGVRYVSTIGLPTRCIPWWKWNRLPCSIGTGSDFLQHYTLSPFPIITSSTSASEHKAQSVLVVPCLHQSFCSQSRDLFPSRFSSFFLSTRVPPTGPCILPTTSWLLPWWASCKWRRLLFH